MPPELGMSAGTKRRALDRILVDLNTQCDYLLPNGRAPVRNRSEIIPNIRRLMEWARNAEIPVLSSLDAHRPVDALKSSVRCCVDCTPGQRKLPFTLLPRRILLPGDNTLDVPHNLLQRYRQVVFVKRSRDLLDNPKADRLLSDLPSTHLIVCGVLTEQCIKASVLAMLMRRHHVIVVQDACGHWNRSEAELALRQMDAKGAFLMTTEQILAGGPLPERVFEFEMEDLEYRPKNRRPAALGTGANGDGQRRAENLKRSDVSPSLAGLPAPWLNKSEDDPLPA
jgi:nicotinamidase-related amidase